jgi:ATP-dependent RNA helicase DeaD
MARRGHLGVCGPSRKLDVFVINLAESKAFMTEAAPEVSTFAELNLSDVCLRALDAAGYTKPTPVQAGVIPHALSGVDVVGQARTGTGKTASFVIPILEKVRSRKEKGGGPQALILVPTRELAVQVRDEVVKLAKGRTVAAVAVYGGKPLGGQIEKLRAGAHVVVGTPGRVIDLLGRKALRLNELDIVVLDEADRMLDIGFRPDIEKILRQCPTERQTLLLSATIPPPIEKIAQRYMKTPVKVNFSMGDLSVETIEQFYFTVEHTRKFELLMRLLAREKPKQAIIFCRTKRGVDKIHQRLTKKSVRGAACIHGDMAQSARDRVMRDFRDGQVRFLVATDVVGRGIDVSSVSHIINFDIPEFSDDYVHRVGRTGRMGREGVAYSFVTQDEGHELTRIEYKINRLLKRDHMDGMASPKPTPPPAPPKGGIYSFDSNERPAPSESDFAEAGSKKPRKLNSTFNRTKRRR